jgi:hypothetical protein
VTGFLDEGGLMVKGINDGAVKAFNNRYPAQAWRVRGCKMAMGLLNGSIVVYNGFSRVFIGVYRCL